MADAGSVRLQLNDLEAEEAQIMRELREMDEKANAETEANRRRAEQYRDDPAGALSSLLLQCEKEVRDAKGYIADQGPPLRIVRLRHGETGPKSATYLSRPRNTGVDFTVPVTLKAYIDIIKQPIFLNQIRDKIKQCKFASTEDYLDDMRLLVRNTAQFNKGPDLAWVVQHARFLLEAAEDAVTSRRRQFREIEDALRHRTTPKATRQSSSALTAVGKRKRSHVPEKTNGDVSENPAVGSAIEIYWPSYRKWYLAYITEHGDDGTCHVRYDEDNSEQWVSLDHERWRTRQSRSGAGAAKGKRAHEHPSKRRKSVATASPAAEAPVQVSGGISPEDLDAIKIDLFAKFDDLRDSIMEQLNDHLSRMDRAMLRSDALSRVLVQVEDTQASLETKIHDLGARFGKIEQKMSKVLEAERPRTEIRGSGNGENKNKEPRSEGRSVEIGVGPSHGVKDLNEAGKEQTEAKEIKETKSDVPEGGRDTDRDPDSEKVVQSVEEVEVTETDKEPEKHGTKARERQSEAEIVEVDVDPSVKGDIKDSKETTTIVVASPVEHSQPTETGNKQVEKGAEDVEMVDVEEVKEAKLERPPEKSSQQEAKKCKPPKPVGPDVDPGKSPGEEKKDDPDAEKGKQEDEADGDEDESSDSGSSADGDESESDDEVAGGTAGEKRAGGKEPASRPPEGKIAGKKPVTFTEKRGKATEMPASKKDDAKKEETARQAPEATKRQNTEDAGEKSLDKVESTDEVDRTNEPTIQETSGTKKEVEVDKPKSNPEAS